MKKLLLLFASILCFSIATYSQVVKVTTADIAYIGKIYSRISGDTVYAQDIFKFLNGITVTGKTKVDTLEWNTLLPAISGDSSFQFITADTIGSNDSAVVFAKGIRIPHLANSVSKVLTIDIQGDLDTTQTSTLSDYFSNNTVPKIKVDSLQGVKTINSITGNKIVYVDGSTGYVAGKTQTSIESYVFDSINVGSTATGKARAVLDTIAGLRLYNGATVFDDMFFPFTTGQSGVAGYPPFVADSNYYSFTVDTTGPSQCVMYFIVQLPHKWKEGSNIYPHVHYKHTTSAGTPTFRLRYKWYENGGSTANQSFKYYTMNLTTGTTNNTAQMSYGSTFISGSGKTVSSILICQLYLVSTTGAAPVYAYQMDIHIEIDALGSKTEAVK